MTKAYYDRGNTRTKRNTVDIVYDILQRLSEGSCNLSKITLNCNVSHGLGKNIISSLESADIISRHRDPRLKRKVSYIFRLTSKGMKIKIALEDLTGLRFSY